MKQVTQINCVCCPNNCLVTIDENGTVSGNRCPNGSAYALGQIKDPQRQLVAEVRLLGADADRCPVKGDRPVPTSALEEIAFRNGFIDREQLLRSAEKYGKSPYGEHLKAVAEGKVRY